MSSRGGPSRRARAPFVRPKVEKSSEKGDWKSVGDDLADSKGFKRLLEQARETGQLVLSARELTEVPEAVWRVDRPDGDGAEKHSLSTDAVPLDWGSEQSAETAWWLRKALERLVLADNRLAALSSGVGRLDQLCVLDLAHNTLTALPDDITLCVKLQRLILSHNLLETLPTAIGNLTDLRLLKADHNRLAQLPSSVGDLHFLEEADLTANRLTRLPANSLNGWRARELRLGENGLLELADEVGWLQSLVLLDLHGNALEQLPAAVGSLGRLTLLYVSSNQLSSLPPLVACKELTELHAACNQIRQLPDDFFTPLSSLKTVDLRENGLAELPASVVHISGLERLNLEKNDLKKIPAEIALIPTLKSLLLAGNPIRTVRRDILQRGTVELIEYLKRKLDGDFADSTDEAERHLQLTRQTAGDAKNTKTLRRSGENLEALPDTALADFAVGDINTVDLSDNKLTCLPSSLIPLAACLTELILSKNRICVLAEDIVAQLINLRRLDLSVNQLAQLPSTLSACARLLDLNLANNRFASVPREVFALAASLESLFLAHNRIERLEATDLITMTRLTTLDLSCNQLASVPPLIGRMKLRCLKLEGNCFKVPRAATLAKGTDEILKYLKGRLPDAVSED